jgi:outer membrane protein TolC
MSLQRPSAIALFVMALLPRAGSAQAEDPILGSLIEEALARNPEVAAAQHSLTAAEARPDQAGSRPGPVVSLTYQNDGLSPSLGDRDMTMLSFGASQEIPYPGKRRLRRQVAEAEAGVAALGLERARLSLVASVKRAYYGLALARSLAALAEEQREVWREIQEAARVRYASAVGQQQELLRAQVEATRVHALHAQHHAEARARLAELNRLVGRPATAPLDIATLPALSPEARALDALVEWSEANSPELKSWAATVQRDELALALARKGFKPDLAIQGAYINRGRLDPMWQAGVSLALPPRAQARAAVAEAEARLSASRARVDDLRARLRSAVEQRLALLVAAEQIEATYREGMLPLGQVLADSALARYRAGQGQQLAVLESVVTVLDDRADYQRLLAAHASERARLDEVSLDAGDGMQGLLMHGRTGFSGGAMGGAGGGMPATGTTPMPPPPR